MSGSKKKNQYNSIYGHFPHLTATDIKGYWADCRRVHPQSLIRAQGTATNREFVLSIIGFSLNGCRSITQ
jgi:hypothetical protein